MRFRRLSRAVVYNAVEVCFGDRESQNTFWHSAVHHLKERRHKVTIQEIPKLVRKKKIAIVYSGFPQILCALVMF